MPLLLIIVIGFLILGVALIVMGVPYANRQNARLCPQCRYDLSATPKPPCPECGFRWRSRIALTHRPARRGRIILGVTSVLMALYLALPVITNKHWTRFVPRPVLAVALDVTVEPPPIAQGRLLPTPDPNLKYAKDRWDRLVWQQQTAHALHEFLDRIEQSRGTLAEIEALVPLAIEANALYQEHGSTFSRDAWPMDDVKQRARELQPVLDARAPLPLGTWASAEMQFMDGRADLDQPNWIYPPREILLPLTESPDPAVRAYVLDRLVYDPDPPVSAMYDRLAESDPDPAIRQRAKKAADWRRVLRGFP